MYGEGLRAIAKRFISARRYNPELMLLGVVLFGCNPGATRIIAESRRMIEDELGGAAPVLLPVRVGIWPDARGAVLAGWRQVYIIGLSAGGPARTFLAVPATLRSLGLVRQQREAP